MNAPYYKCEYRDEDCHSTCRRYEAFRQYREKIYHQAKVRVEVMGYFSDEQNKNIFGRGRRR